jgi:hypothetical protein
VPSHTHTFTYDKPCVGLESESQEAWSDQLIRMTARQLVRRQQLLTRELVEQDQQQLAASNKNNNKNFKLEDFDMIKTIGTGRPE